MESHSVSEWIAGLREADQEAAQKIWSRYSARLLKAARQRLANVPKTVIDEEDIAQCVFRSICRAATAGRFHNVRDRDDLWWFLLAVTKQKVVDHIRRETALKRRQGRVQSESSLVGRNADAFSLDELIGDELTPDFIAMLVEQNQRLLLLLPNEKLRRIAVFRIEGYTVSEIANELAISTRSVERKLNLIREKWSRELTSSE